MDFCGYLWIIVAIASSLIYQLVDMPAGTVLKPGVEFLFGGRKDLRAKLSLILSK